MKKAAVVLSLTALLVAAGLFALFFSRSALIPDASAINDAAMTAAKSDEGEKIAQILTDELMRQFDEMNEARRKSERLTFIFLGLLTAVVTASGLLLIYYCEKSVLAPFRDLKRFAESVAMGNLDIPLKMDKRGSFGAFTESFDLMREELKKSRENERKASQSKKELVASLSHDIKTPAASIKAVTELMLAKSRDNEEQLNTIIAKVDQIDLLITNMFQATLEELEQLTVIPEELPSTVLYEIIKNADYDNKVDTDVIPECVFSADKTRLQQIFDNIISNSYKYAGTEIQISAYFERDFLAVEVRDGGTGVASDDLPLIFSKFYRGANSAGKSGSGLGLYISKHLITKMGGDILCGQDDAGFVIKILLQI